MKADKFNQHRTKQAFVLAEQEQLDRIEKQLSELHRAISDGSFQVLSIGRHVPEREAKKLLQKGTTWFWEQRKAGNLDYAKVGNTIYYRLEDLERLIEENYSR